MVEIVSQIKTAEEQAENIKKSARQQARILGEEAVAAGKKLVEAKREEALQQAADMLAVAQADAKSYLEECNAASEEESRKLSTSAQAKMEKAAGYIVERIVERL